MSDAEIISQLRAELARIHDCFPASSRPASTDVMAMKAAVQKMQSELAAAKTENAALRNVAKVAICWAYASPSLTSALRTLAEKGVVL